MQVYFDSFSKASTFAQQQALATGAPAKLQSEGRGYVVTTVRVQDQEKHTKSIPHQEPAQPITRPAPRDPAVNALNERTDELNEWAFYLYELSDSALVSLWNRRDELDIDADELDILRACARSANNVSIPRASQIEFCSQCGLLISNCVC